MNRLIIHNCLYCPHWLNYEQLQKNQVNNKLTNVSYAKYLNGTTDRITVVAINFLLSRDSRLWTAKITSVLFMNNVAISLIK